MKTHRVRFDGAILERGFWIYVWRIRSGEKEFLYVGRTGDSSSRFAASPFARLGQHLDLRRRAEANMLLRHVRKKELDPLKCSFEMIAFGPLFPEQKDLKSHRCIRDIVAPLECAVAEHLRQKGYAVVGNHSARHTPDRRRLARLCRAIDTALRAAR